jgi:hypothetical protein
VLAKLLDEIRSERHVGCGRRRHGPAPADGVEDGEGVAEDDREGALGLEVEFEDLLEVAVVASRSDTTRTARAAPTCSYFVRRLPPGNLGRVLLPVRSRPAARRVQGFRPAPPVGPRSHLTRPSPGTV